MLVDNLTRGLITPGFFFELTYAFNLFKSIKFNIRGKFVLQSDKSQGPWHGNEILLGRVRDVPVLRQAWPITSCSFQLFRLIEPMRSLTVPLHVCQR